MSDQNTSIKYKKAMLSQGNRAMQRIFDYTPNGCYYFTFTA